MEEKTNTKPRVCIVDFRLTGHHAFTMGHYSIWFQKVGYEVDLVVGDPLSCKEKIAAAVPELNLTNIKIHETEAANLTKRVLGCRVYFRLRQLEKDLASIERKFNISYDLIYFPYLDDLSQMDPIFPYLIKPPFLREFSGLIMEPRAHLLARTKLPKSLLFTTWIARKETRSRQIGTLVEDASPHMENVLGKPLVVYPDFCGDSEAATELDRINNLIREQVQGRTLTSLTGSIQPHKSIDLFFDIVETVDPEKHFFVIAGSVFYEKFEEPLRTRIKQMRDNPPDNLLFFDEWIESESVFDNIIMQSDIVFAFYRNFKKSSHMLIKAAFHHKPVIVNNKYLMGKRTQRYELGFSTDESSVINIYKENLFEKWQSNPTKRKEFLEINSASRLEKIFSDLFQRQKKSTISKRS